MIPEIMAGMVGKHLIEKGQQDKLYNKAMECIIAKDFDTANKICDEAIQQKVKSPLKAPEAVKAMIPKVTLNLPERTILYDWYYAKYKALDGLGQQAYDKRKYCLAVALSNSEKQEAAKNDFKKYDTEYAETYLKQPYQNRKFLVPVNDYTTPIQNSFTVLSLERLKRTGIEFRDGHPEPNQLYIGHPFIPNQYIQFEDYELKLIQDKVHEFCNLAQCLGATEITIECINTTNSDKQQNRSLEISGGIEYSDINASGSYNSERSNQLIEKLRQAINSRQVFQPKEYPFLPPDMTWYEHEASWQHLYKQRMHGTLLEHEERIEIRKSRFIRNEELQSIKAALDTLNVKINGGWKRSLDERSSFQENAILDIKIKFAPIQDLATNQLSQNSTPSELSQTGKKADKPKWGFFKKLFKRTDG